MLSTHSLLCRPRTTVTRLGSFVASQPLLVCFKQWAAVSTWRLGLLRITKCFWWKGLLMRRQQREKNTLSQFLFCRFLDTFRQFFCLLQCFWHGILTIWDWKYIGARDTCVSKKFFFCFYKGVGGWVSAVRPKLRLFCFVFFLLNLPLSILWYEAPPTMLEPLQGNLCCRG